MEQNEEVITGGFDLTEENKEFYVGLLGLNSARSSELTGDSLSIVLQETEDIDALYKKVIALDYKILYPITNESWGERRFFVKAPDGMIVHVVKAVPAVSK
jgi:uncharacterized glyoxalase superfamily protein PhnB